MTEKKLAVIILDALDSYNVQQLGLENIENLSREHNSNVLGVSTLPHTAQSNPMIWGGFHNTDKYWVKEPGEKWTDPSTGFSREEGKETSEAERVWRRDDFKQTFIWDVLHYRGVDASAIHIPITLPPYNFNTVKSFDMGDYWFPKDEEQMREHVREMPVQVAAHMKEGKDFIAASIQMPDKWLHGVAEGQCSEEFIMEEAQELDKRVDDLIHQLESNGYDWVILGDHGSPCPGAIRVPEVKQLLPRHRKNSLIISNIESTPSYTDELYDFFLDYFGVEDAEFRELGESFIGNSASERVVPDL